MDENNGGGLAKAAKKTDLDTSSRVFRFLDFCLDGESLTLSQSGDRVPLPPKATQLLLMLVDKAPRLVTRDEMRAELWRESTFIEFEGSLNTCVRQVRSALGDSASRSEFIQTMPKHGYRFVAKLDGVPVSPSRFGMQVTTVAVALVAITLLAILLSPPASQPIAPELLVVLPVEVSSSQSVDPLAGYGIAMIASGRIGNLKPHRLAVVNSRSLRELVVSNGDLDRLTSPDYVVRTRIRGLDDEYVLDTSLRRNNTGQIVSTHTETINADISTVLRVSPEIIVGWLTDELDLANDDEANLSPSGDGRVWSNELIAAFWHLEANTLESVGLAVEKFNNVLVENPENVWALEGKLAALGELSFWQAGTPAAARTFANMEDTARFMLDNDIHSGSSYQAIGFVSLFRDWDLSTAINNTEAALLISPDDARNHGLYAAAQAASGDTAGAVRSAEIAERLDPATMAVRSDRCWFLLFDKRYSEAAELCASITRLDNRDFSSRLGNAHAQAMLGNKKAALQIMVDSIRLIDDTAFEGFTAVPSTWQELGCLRSAEILSDGASSRVMHFQIAKYHAQCGKPAETLKELRLSLERKEYSALFMRVSSEFESLRDDPEFKNLQQLLP